MSIALVNQTPANLAGGGGSAAKSFTIPAPTAGNSLFLLVREFTGVAVSSVSGGGVTWAKVASIDDGVSNVSEIWAGANSPGSGTTITVTLGAIYDAATVACIEVSGTPTTVIADPSTGLTANGRSGTPTGPSITPTAGKPIIIFAVDTNDTNAGTSPSTGFTALSD